MSSSAVIWVAYTTPEHQFHIAVPYVEGMTALDAIQQSELTTKVNLPEPLNVGIFGVRAELSQVLTAGDRVEIYRTLTINPLDIRRNRAQKNPVGRFGKSNRAKNLQGRMDKK